MAVVSEDPLLSEWMAHQQSDSEEFFFRFKPRIDDPVNFDQQQSFVDSADPVSFLVGGNAAGTTEAAAAKCAKFLLHRQPPPRKNTPFWIIADTYDQVTDVCWSEKLIGHSHIPECEVDWDNIAWLSQKEGKPRSVPLKPWPKARGGNPDHNWRIEFKSYEQGRRAMQAKSIGGFWFSEQFPLDIFLEILRGCRDCMFPGGQFAEFTPIDPALCMWVEKAMEDPPDGWKFYRANTQKNIGNLRDGWYEQFFAMVPEEMRETRQIGALASFEGQIYPSFMPDYHVIDQEKIRIPAGTYHAMASDWGASAEHPHVTLWGYRDTIGNWVIYDEYWSPDQTKITMDHAAEVLERCEQWGWPIERYREGSKWKKRIHSQRDALWGVNHGDPARPGEITEFNRRGIPSDAARNAVYNGIDTVRKALKPHAATGEAGLRISSKCVHLIEEMRKYRWKRGKRPESGAILNPAVATPVPLKRDDDTCFPAGELIDTPCGPRPIESLATGDQVFTHLGIGRVIGFGCTGVADLIKMTMVDGREVTCTADHKFLNTYGDFVEASQCQGHYLNVKRWSMPDTHGIGTRSRSRFATECISAVASETPQVCYDPRNFIDEYGLITTEKYQREWPSTTLMETQQTTRSTISHCSPLASTANFIAKTSPRPSLPPLSGMAPRKGANGTAITLQKCGKTGDLRNTSVNTVVKPTRARTELSCDSVRTNARADRGGNLESITNRENAKSAESCSQSIVTQKRRIAARNVQPLEVGSVEKAGRAEVYCISTTHGTLVVNGVVAKNCDALRYLLHTESLSNYEPPSATSKAEHPTDRQSVQLVREKLDRASRRIAGHMPNRG